MSARTCTRKSVVEKRPSLTRSRAQRSRYRLRCLLPAKWSPSRIATYCETYRQCSFQEPRRAPIERGNVCSVEKVFSVIKQMEADGVIGRYAIGGAIGAVFWLEPMTTKDIDVFVLLPKTSGGTIPTLSPIDDYLQTRGYVASGQYLLIEGWPVEFISPGSPLVEEALAESVERDVDGIATRVFTAEHLAAICLQVGRAT